MVKGNPKWEQFEKEVRDLLDLRSTPGSGNQWHDVSDGVSNPKDAYKLMVDCKFTETASFSLNGKFLQDWWAKATELGYHFALPVRLQGAMGGRARILEWATIPLDDYAELLEAIRILNGPKRCGAMPHWSGERDIHDPASFPCCRRLDHFDRHDNGTLEWTADS